MIIIFSGYNQRAVIAFLRALKKNYIENYIIIACSKEDTILKTLYKKHVYCIRNNKELNKKELLNIIIRALKEKNEEKALIIPSTESLNRFLLKNRSEFEEKGCIIPIVEKSLYEEISDKESFWKICKAEALCVPQLMNIHEKFEKSYVAKPKKYVARDGNTYSPILVFNSQEHNAFLNKNIFDEFDCQEYIEGNSYYLLFYFSKNGTVYKFSQINYAQQDGGKSILAAEPAYIHEGEIANNYIKLFEKLKYTGFVMIELREKNGIYYMIEANPRLWGPSQLFVDAGVPFFEAFLNDYDIFVTVYNSNVNYNAKYLWSGGYFGEKISADTSVWLGNGEQIVTEQWVEYIRSDLYNRKDTKNLYNEKL